MFTAVTLHTHAPVVGAHVDAARAVLARVEISAELQCLLTEHARVLQTTLAPVLAHQVHARAVIETAMTETVGDVRLAAIALEAGAALAPEAAVAVDDVTLAFMLARRAVAGVDLVLALRAVVARLAAAAVALVARLSTAAAVQTRCAVADVALAHHRRVRLLCKAIATAGGVDTYAMRARIKRKYMCM